jgi:diacylglycerol kinase family enzyme
VKYLLVFNPKAKRYSREAEATIVEQASRILRGSSLAVTYTVPQHSEHGRRYDVADFARKSRSAGCVIAVGGDGTINLVVAAMARQGLHPHVPLGVIPYGTGNNLVRSFGLERGSEKALLTIRQGHTVHLDIGLINQQYYCINASIGLFAHVLAHRVTKSLVGYTYETLRHIGFTPWPMRIRYTDAAGHVIELPPQRYILGAMLNTSHYASILRMAPDVVSDDGLFDVKFVRETPVLAYPLVFTILLTGQYDLSRNTMAFRAKRLEVAPEDPCRGEADGDLIPTQPSYCIEIAGHLRLIVPPFVDEDRLVKIEERRAKLTLPVILHPPASILSRPLLPAATSDLPTQ